MKDLFETINELALAEIEKFGAPTISNYNLSIKKGEQIANILGGGGRP